MKEDFNLVYSARNERRLQVHSPRSLRALSAYWHTAAQNPTPDAVLSFDRNKSAGAGCLRRRREKRSSERGWYEKSAIALLRKGNSRLWTNVFVRERPLPFLKPRPTDAFRIILLLYIYTSSAEFRADIFVYDCKGKKTGSGKSVFVPAVSERGIARRKIWGRGPCKPFVYRVLLL